MNNTHRYLIGGVAGVILSFLLFFLLGSGNGSVGGTTNYGGGLVVDDLKVNTTYGVTVDKVIPTTCNLAITAARLPLSTTTQPFQCAVTGVVSGDYVIVQLASDGGGIAAGSGGIVVGYSNASTTDGYIEVGLYSRPTTLNATVATSSFALATTSVRVLVLGL